MTKQDFLEFSEDEKLCYYYFNDIKPMIGKYRGWPNGNMHDDIEKRLVERNFNLDDVEAYAKIYEAYLNDEEADEQGLSFKEWC